MLTAPAQLLVRGVATLPEALRPGVFIALIIMLIWFLVARRGLRAFWQSICRGAANVVSTVVGLVLLPEYAATTARRRRGQPPGRIALLMTPPSEMLLDVAASVHERHQVEENTKRASKPPWKLCIVIVVVVAGGWIAMDRVPTSDPAKEDLVRVYQPWCDIEAWADVDPERVADCGF